MHVPSALIEPIVCEKAKPGTDNDCTRLARVLSAWETLPDHVCPNTYRHSCANSLAEIWPGEEIPINWHGREIHLPISSGLAIQARSLMDWPYRIWNSQAEVILIVRQWVEDSPEDKLITELESDPAFVALLDHARRAEELEPGYIERGIAESYECASGHFQNRLAERGLPNTPSTARYGLRRASGDPPDSIVEPPTRGVLVTTFCIIPTTLSPSEDHDHATSTCRMDFAPEWVTDDLLRSANKKANSHREWWAKKVAAEPRIDMRKHNRRIREPDPYDALIEQHRAGKFDRPTLMMKTRDLTPGNKRDKDRARRMVSERLRRLSQKTPAR